MFTYRRDWTKTTISKTHDTREIVKANGDPTSRANRGSLTVSLPVELGRKFFDRHRRGVENFVMVKLEPNGGDLLLTPARQNERGRKMTLSTPGTDYRAFFDGAVHKWIDNIQPFSATPTDAVMNERGDVVIKVPPEKDRVPMPPYTPRLRHKKKPKPKPQMQLPLQQGPRATTSNPFAPPPKTDDGKMYLVLVPPEKDQQFHTLLSFLKLEALKE